MPQSSSERQKQPQPRRSSELNFTECEASTFRGSKRQPIDTLEATLARDLQLLKHTNARDLREWILKRDLVLAPSMEENELSETYSSLRWLDQNVYLEQGEGMPNHPDLGKVSENSTRTRGQNEAAIKKIQTVPLKREKQKKFAISRSVNDSKKVETAKIQNTAQPKSEVSQANVVPQLNGDSNSITSKSASAKNDKDTLEIADKKQCSATNLSSRVPKTKYSQINGSLAGYFRAESQPRHLSKIQMSAHQILLPHPSYLFQRFALSAESLEAEYARCVFNAGDLFYLVGKITPRDLGLSSVAKYVVDSGIYLWLADILQSMMKGGQIHLQIPVIQYHNKARLNVQAVPLKRTKREFMSIIHSGKLPTPMLMENCLMCESKATRQMSEDEITLDITGILENCVLQKQPQVLLWIRIDPLLKHSPSLKISFPLLYCAKSNNK